MDKIIKLDKRHLEQLADVDFECAHSVDVQRNLSREDMKEYILQRINKKQEIFFGYKQNDELIGYVTMIPHFPGYKHCEVYWLAVKKKVQKQGIGRKLMRFIEEYAKEKGFRKVCLYNGKEMKEAQSFYERIGYKLINEFKGYYGFSTGSTTAVLFAKSL